MTDATGSRIVHHIETALAEVIASMTGEQWGVAIDESATEAPPLEDVITWQQAFSAADGPSLWIAAAKELWEDLGRATLGAAGIDEVTDDDCRSTWHEILNQTAGGIAAAVTAELEREVTALKGSEIDAEPGGLAWVVFSVTKAGKTWAFKAAWTAALSSLCEPRREEAGTVLVKETPASRTFDLLLEVALPIAVSFGRTSMQIREVLKLNTGSIVELDRFVTDPVEVIVNDCVIARGEVVVVDGNYGVRINQLASREERLRSGMAESARKGGRP